MKENVSANKMSIKRKTLMVVIDVAVAIYCAPELKEKLKHGYDSIINEWRKMR